MGQYIAAKIEGGRIVDAWGAFPTPDAAADWLGKLDDRMRDYVWDRNGDHWSTVLEEGDLEQARFEIRLLEAPSL